MIRTLTAGFLLSIVFLNSQCSESFQVQPKEGSSLSADPIVGSDGIKRFPEDANSTVSGNVAFGPGIELHSGDESQVLRFQSDGNIALYSNQKAVWATGTSSKKARSFFFANGSLYVEDENKKVIWSTHTDGRGARLQVLNNGILAIFDSAGDPIWSTTNASSSSDSLYVGDSLTLSNPLASSDGSTKMTFKSGSIEIQHGLAVISMSLSPCTNTWTLQPDGENFVACGSAPQVGLLGSGSEKTKGARVTLTNDGNLVMFKSGAAVFGWKIFANTLMPGDALSLGGSLKSVDQRSVLSFESDGNLRLTFDGKVLWESRTGGSNADRAVLQSDGNFVIYAGQKAVWAAGNRYPGSRLVLQDDSNLVLDHDGSGVWATHTVNEEKLQQNQGGTTIRAVRITTPDGDVPYKGAALRITYILENNGNATKQLQLRSLLSSERFTGLTGILLPGAAASVPAHGKTTVQVDVPRFFSAANNPGGSRFALGSGRYELDVNLLDGSTSIDHKTTSFRIQKSNAVFPLFFVDNAYFNVADRKGADVNNWIKETYTRPASIFNKANNASQDFSAGFDAMLDVKHIWDVAPSPSTAGVGHEIEALGEVVKNRIGFNPYSQQHDQLHGYDYFVSLDQDDFGGVTFGFLVAAGAGIGGDFSKGRTQMVLIHEVGHVFGSPHCDPDQGFVMCSGEKNARYIKSGIFVWLKDSIDVMQNRIQLFR